MSAVNDTLRSIQRLQVIDLISEGPIGGLVNGLKSVYLDGVPVEAADGSRNIDGVVFALANGDPTTPGGSAERLPAANVVQTEHAVQEKVAAGAPITRTITTPTVNAVRVTLAVPQLTSQSGDGSLGGASVGYRISTRSAGGDWQLANLGAGSVALFNGSISTVHSNGAKLVAATLKVSSPGFISGSPSTFKLQQRSLGDWADVPGAVWSRARSTPLNETVTLTALSPALYEWRLVISSGASRELRLSGTGTLAGEVGYITGKATSTYKRDVVVQLSGSAPWDVRVERFTPDSTDEKLVNAFYWDTYTEIQHLRMAYKHCAVAGLMIDAGSSGSAPSRAYDMLLQLIEVPSNYNPITRVYTGVWDGTFITAWTDNPAWVFWAVATNPRWGLGRELGIGKLSKWALYAIGRYCDALVPDGRGGTEPRFTINCQILERQQARTLLQQLAATMRALAFAAGDQVHLVQDAPASIDFVYAPANVVDGAFNYTGVSRQTRSSVFIVYWNDLSQMGRAVPEVYTAQALVRRFGVKEKIMRPLGITSRGQAARLARWAAYSEEHEGETVAFRVGAGGTLVRPGRVFQIADPNEAGARMGGLLSAATDTLLTLDAPVDIPEALGPTGMRVDYTITIQLPDPINPANLISQTRSVLTRGTAQRTLTLATPLSATPDAATPWLLQSDILAATTWRCLNVAEVPGHDKDEYELIAVAHNPSKFAHIEQGLMLEARPISRVSVIAPSVADITLAEHTYLVGNTYRSRANVSFPEPIPGLLYELRWRMGVAPWADLPATAANSIDIEGLPPGQLGVLLRTRNALGNTSPWRAAGMLLQGHVSPAAAVSGFTATVVQGGVQLTWASTDPAYLKTTITTQAGAVIFDQPGQSHLWAWPAAGSYTLSAIDTDTSLNPSAQAATLTVVVDDAMQIQWANLGGAPTTANLIRNAAFAPTAGEWQVAHMLDATHPSVPPGAPSARVLRSTARDYYAGFPGAPTLYPVQPGEVFEVEVWVGLNTPNPHHIGMLSLSFDANKTDLLHYPGQYIPADFTGWRKVFGQITIAPNQHWICPILWLGQDSNAGSTYESFFSEPILRRLPASVASAATTAVWGAVSGSGKPQDNATRNNVFYQDTDPAALAADGDLWQTVSPPSREFKRVGGAWVATVGPGSVNTPQIAPGAASETIRFYDALGVWHYINA